VFSPSSTFARESFLDEIAHAAGKDPVAFRLEMLTGPDIVEVGEGDAKLKVDRRRLRRVIAAAAERAGWGEKLPAGRGRGFACNVYDGDTHVAYVVDVAVRETGEVHVDRVVAAIDCGLVINPTGIEQQVEGGVIWGLSQTLKGSITIRDGRIEQNNYRDYEVARMRDSPRIDVVIIPSEGEQPFGVGEPPVPPLAPAVANAIFAATGKRLRHLPVRPEDLIH
jgi:isoquinoline 1-oxidoreductase beta subunit